ncbi:MAG: DegT/DnrJ/EryC1/StrS family aminotransferase [Xanthomonadales bacterium]|nr:DegT/DnrJ/EryC1/StrS family aminotransferase [Xanthomonadales bacterium]
MARRPPSGEIPPTAGLPPRWRDLLPSPAAPSLADGLAGLLGTERVQLECSGTAALIVALATLQRTSGRRRVIVPAYTCPLVALAVAHCGLELVPCDLAPCDLAPGSIDLDPALLAGLCDADTLAVLPTHLGGRVADVATTLAIARDAGAWVIEDAAQALGARVCDRAVGLAGDAGFFSLAVGKGLTTFEGGALVASDPALAAALAETSRDIVPRRPAWELRRSLELFAYHALYRPRLLGLAYGMPLRRALRRGDPVRAVGDDFSPPIPLHPLGAWRSRVGARALERLPAFLAAAEARALPRAERLNRIAGVEVLGDRPGTSGTWPFLWVRMPDQGARDRVLQRLWGAGLGVSRLFIHALPDYPYLHGIVPAAEVPQARRLAATTLTVSNSPWLDEAAFEAICSAITAAVAGRA